MKAPSPPRRRFLALAVLGVTTPALLCSAAAAQTATAQPDPADEPAGELLLRADGIRFPRESFETEVTVQNFSADTPGEMRRYRVLSRGNDHTIVLTLEPAAERGQALLMSGRNLWIFMPSVSQPVRLSLAQRLTGQVANGDLARANFAGDYTPTLAGRETVDGEDCQLLELRAVDRSVTYASVRYWVRAADARPVRAEFHALSGRLLKTCRYLDFRELAGQLRPARLVMEDALKHGERSEMSYQSMTLRELPERMFTREYLRRLG